MNSALAILMATILVPALVSSLTALWVSRAVTRIFAATLTDLACSLHDAAQAKTTDPPPFVSKPQDDGRHSARPNKRQQ
ncbi:hypothetical protein AB0D34_07895 [Streptomyces sp. NPDC048420]|uniref:hypothetical protein n=1 Tax=Streptomyces sp. NPDC048420 TaxID=3155755 RepID=UPI0034373946